MNYSFILIILKVKLLNLCIGKNGKVIKENNLLGDCIFKYIPEYHKHHKKDYSCNSKTNPCFSCCYLNKCLIKNKCDKIINYKNKVSRIYFVILAMLGSLMIGIMLFISRIQYYKFKNSIKKIKENISIRSNKNSSSLYSIKSNSLIISFEKYKIDLKNINKNILSLNK